MIGEFRLKVFVGFFTACMIGVATCFLPTGLRRVIYPTAYAVTTFTVNTADDHDDGTCNVADCTLREAINAANAAGGSDLINFNIPGGGVQSIMPASALPAITDPVSIDGTTQPGFSSTPLIELNGAGTVRVHGLNFQGASTGSIVKGLAINRFGSFGVNIDAGTITVQG